MEGAEPREVRIPRVALDANVAHFRMKQTLDGAVSHDHSAAYPGADRHIRQRAQSRAGTESRLSERGCIHIGVEGNGTAEALERRHDADVRPLGLGRCQDPPPARGAGVEVHRTEGGNADRGQRTVLARDLLEELRYGRESGSGGSRRNDRPTVLANLERTMAGGADDFGAAGFDRAI